MRKIFILITTVIIGLSMVKCDDPFENQVFSAYEDQPISLWLNSRPEYSMWVQLLKKADLYNALNIGTQFTCFIADNNAVAAYLNSNGYQSVEEMNDEDARYLMQFHIIADVAYQSVSFLGKMEDKTLSGDNLTIKAEEGGINAYYINNYAGIIIKDQEAINGTLHKIDKVLNPVVETVWDLINNDRYSIFRDAIKECGLQERLNQKERYFGEIAIRDYKTVFVVSDSIFAENDIHTLEQLKTIYPDVKTGSDSSAFYKYIAYHVIPSFSDFTDLGTINKDAVDKVKNVPTFAPNELISIADVKGTLVFNRTADKPVHLLTGKYDMLANNGFVHEIDGLLPVSPAEAASVFWELTDYDAFKILPDYKKWSSKLDGNKYSIDRENVVGIRWKTVPDDDNAVRYYLRSLQWFQDDDAVTMALGNVGWAEFDMPVIAKGKYKVSIKYLGYNARGTGRFYFDGMPFGGDFAFTSNYSKDLGEITFPEQTSHVFKIVVVKKGDMEIDQFIFKPVK